MADKSFSIDDYRKKRDFGRTPEPEPAAPEAPAGGPSSAEFVIHRHEATRLHYDLRLEMKGVLVSFAVPKGFSYVPEHKHLAVRTEDHPIEYLEFDGVIPKGQYGAGTMTIWDRGTYRVTEGGDGPTGLEGGKLEVELDGGRLRGEWHLVRIQKSEKDWLLFKARDRYARQEDEPDFPLDLSRTRPAALPKRPKAMRPKNESGPFSDPDWLFELRFAGTRVLASVGAKAVRFAGADGKTFRSGLPEIAADLARTRAGAVLLDGVLVAPDAQDRPDEALLEERLASGETSGLKYYVFDLLHFDRWSLCGFPLLDRKRALKAVLPKSAAVLFVDHVAGRGDELAEVVAAGGLSGVVAKRAVSPYHSGASDDWRLIRGATPKERGKKSVLESLRSQKKRRATRVKLSNLRKVYWPKEGTTKGQLLDYYEQVADTLLPYLKDRPVHMLRYPDGIEGKSFYQKNVTGRIPNWVSTIEFEEKDGEPIRYVVCNDRETLLHLVNLGSIDLHPWLSRTDELDRPDWAILDLDPSSEGFSKVVRIAQTIGKMLRGAGLRPYIKTSGASGLHIYVPIVRQYSYEQARMFCEAVARMTVKEHKEIATVERAVANREDKVYVDFGQNRREQTVVPPWVVRPVPGACVSSPLDWDEVQSDLHPSQFPMSVALERLARLGDLFRGALSDPQDLAPAIQALSEMR